MEKEQILELAARSDDYADQYLQSIGEYHPDWHSVRDEHFYHAAIQQYKDSLLKEVGEPLCYVYKNHEGSYWQAHDLRFKEAHTPVYTSDQVAAAIIKATKPLEERIYDLTACKWPEASTVIPIEINGQLHATSLTISKEIQSIRAQLSTVKESEEN